jgi:hypothetical protein
MLWLFSFLLRPLKRRTGASFSDPLLALRFHVFEDVSRHENVRPSCPFYGASAKTKPSEVPSWQSFCANALKTASSRKCGAPTFALSRTAEGLSRCWTTARCTRAFPTGAGGVRPIVYMIYARRWFFDREPCPPNPAGHAA